jgi:hypothetical protein
MMWFMEGQIRLSYGSGDLFHEGCYNRMLTETKNPASHTAKGK